MNSMTGTNIMQSTNSPHPSVIEHATMLGKKLEDLECALVELANALRPILAAPPTADLMEIPSHKGGSDLGDIVCSMRNRVSALHVITIRLCRTLNL